MRLIRFAEMMIRDVSYALRGFQKNPLMVTALVVTLGLGIGASAAMFSVVDALLLRPLPYGQPEELVQVVSTNAETGHVNAWMSNELAREWLNQADFLESGMRYARDGMLYTGGALAKMVGIQAVSPEFERVLRVRPVLGRGLTGRDARPSAEPVAVLSHAFWTSAFGGDPGTIEQYVEFDGVDYRIVGIMPEGFKFPMYATTAAWIALRVDGTIPGRANAGGVDILGRLGEYGLEATIPRAKAMAAAVAERRRAEDPHSIALRPLGSRRARSSDLRQAVGFLSGAVGLILLIALFNGMGLILVRGWSRAREFAVRVSLGASRRRLIAQLLTQSAALALVAGLVAVGLAILILRTIQGIMPTAVTFFAPYAIEVEGRTLLFAFMTAVGAGLIVGLVPAIRTTRLGRVASKAGLTPYASNTAGKTRLRRGLVIVEVALSVMLLVGAGLLINSFVRLMRVDPGFRVEELAVMDLSFSSGTYSSREARTSFMHGLERRLEAVPGIEGVAVETRGLHFGTELQAEGAEEPAGAQPRLLPSRTVGPDFFQVMGIPIVAGRGLVPGDAAAGGVVIDQNLARLLWGEANAVGRRFRMRTGEPWVTVVGLIEDVQLMGPDDRTGDYEILYAMGPNPRASTMTFNIRTRGDPLPLFDEIRNAVHTLNPEQPIWHLRSAEAAYMDHVAMPRFLTVVVALLSALALLLAGVGIHGVLAFGVTQRRRELGVRIAVGAQAPALARRVVGEGMALAATGAVLGVVGALALSGLVRSLLFGVAPSDPVTIAAVITTVLAAAAVACYWPARRATRVDPMEVLRCE